MRMANRQLKAEYNVVSARVLSIILILGLLPATLRACPLGRKVLVGFDQSPPLQEKVGADQFTGLDLEIVQLVLKQMKCEIQFVELPWTRSIVDLKDGKIDLLGGATISPERKEFAIFSEGYAKSNTYVYTLKKRINEFNGKKLVELKNIPKIAVGVGLGYDYGDLYTEAKSDPLFSAKLSESKDMEALYKKLVNNRVDVAIFDEITLKYLKSSFAKRSNLKKKDESEVVATSMLVDSSEAFFMMSKKTISNEFLANFNLALKKIKSTSEYKKIIKKYY